MTQMINSHTKVKVTLKAFALDHTCQVHDGDVRHTVKLIDINSTCARLRLEKRDGIAPAPGSLFHVNIQLDAPGVETGNLPSIVSWSSGNEFGVEFVNLLQMSVTELQELLDKKAA